ncbi:hypothetical protein [Pontivivens insulae]|uniref:YMGG-like Gly-zipper domain-containing protein n=1 Tax=Pontivivens insulae TaxID=1639689 RepID=A0A2R8ADP9_9RHOB|nr:hypothetical protein [Pontivivens insulae]RED14287.1 hypothetical protein DFR53_1644 [Pontivivens insulae]SPF30364.1 hypothetical protein POI8812_02700 [Pontivivens insulae]
MSILRIAVLSAVVLGTAACTANQQRGATNGAIVGAGVGAVGAAIADQDDVSVLEGAAAGAAIGGAAGAATNQ